MPEPRYLNTYRENEIGVICKAARAGESCGFVGMAGTGKSNIVDVLRERRDIKAQYLGDDVDQIHFIDIDGNTWNETGAGLWQQLSKSLDFVLLEFQAPPWNGVRAEENDAAALEQEVQRKINWICQKRDSQLVLILDDFDEVIARGASEIIEQLNAFRSQGNRGRLSYLLFTKRLPHVLGRPYDMQSQSKFYDLISSHIYALPPHNPDDTIQMLKHLNSRNDYPFNQTVLRQITILGGGHARLIYVIFHSWLKTSPAEQNLVGSFVSRSETRQECRRILASLHPQEQTVAARFANNDERMLQDAKTINHLVVRGFIRSQAERKLFSPIMAAYLRTRQDL